MFKKIDKALRRPSLYEKSAAAFWDDEYISKQMLKAHLDPDFEGASRKLAFIEKSAAWIGKILPPAEFPSLLDIGCGPGIYAERFAKEGYRVTGVDFSRRSIDYARNSAENQNLDITYIFQDYLSMDLGTAFDFATMIYCDYGALSTADRQCLMKNIYRHLKPGGIFLFDVFSMDVYENFEEKQTWEICRSDGFWRQDAHLVLNGLHRYKDAVTLEQICIISEEAMTPYYLWTTYFTAKSLSEEAVSAGFQVKDIFGDVAGSPWTEDSRTIAILLQKK